MSEISRSHGEPQARYGDTKLGEVIEDENLTGPSNAPRFVVTLDDGKPQTRYGDTKRGGVTEDENLTGPSNAPTFVVTQPDEGITVRSSQDDAPPKSKFILVPKAGPSTTPSVPRRQRALSPPYTRSLPPVESVPPEESDFRAMGATEAFDIEQGQTPLPKLKRTKSFWLSAAKRKRTAGARTDISILPTTRCHVPYEGSRRRNETTVDLVVVYMYRGGNDLNAHKRFFECPETGPEPAAHRGATAALPATSAHGIELQPIEPVSSSRSTEPLTHTVVQEQPGRAQSWLSDPSMLPEVIPHNRTICVGYDLDTVTDPSFISYEKTALKLFDLLGELRTSCSTRPVIFIGHGLGCLVVQQAFQRRAPNVVAESLQKACAGILFHHVPVEESGSVGSHHVPRMDKISSNIAPGTATFKPSPAPEQKSTKLDLTDIARHSILHHVLKHGPSEKDHTQSFKFPTKNDSMFQELSAKIVEWSETHQMIMAVAQCDFATVRRLIDDGFKINLRKTLFEETALHLACQMAFSKSQDIDLLVRIGKADVTLRDSSGRTPLHHALRREPPDIEIVRVLLEAGAETMTPDSDHITPWDQAKMTAPRRVRNLLRMRPLIKGPSAAKGAVTRAIPHSRSAGEVCDAYQMAATEMYFDSLTLTEKHLPRHFSITDAIYGTKSLQGMLDDTRSRDIRDELVCRWYHLPANNMAWAEDLFRNRFGMHPTIWSEHVRDSEWPHGRCIVPHTAQFIIDSGESILAICMPYVSYEDNERQRSASGTVRDQKPGTQARWHAIAERGLLQSPSPSGSLETRGVSPDSAQWRRREVSPDESDVDSNVDASDGGASQAATVTLSKEEEDLVRIYLYHSPPLHMRRTLDQYYYYMLEDTEDRDADQVVTRWAKNQLGKPRHNILMVDQLWIWVIKGKDGHPDRIISCFPDREGHESGYLDDLHRNVLYQNKDKRHPITTAADMAARIVTTCSDIFSWSQKAELVRFLHFFEATVGRVGDDEIRLLNKFEENSESLHCLTDKHFQYAKDKDDKLIEMLDVRPQIKLLKEAKDIRDEINIILHVLGEQRQVLEDDIITSFFESNGTVDAGVTNAWREPLRIVKRAIGDFEKMDKQMKGIVDGLNHLLDLQQKQATVWEARSTREGARATSKQGSVMVIFTMVTIIFLPLSFCASFFALDIAEFPTNDQGQTNWPIHRLSGYLFGISLAVIIPLIALAFATERALVACYHLDNLWLIPFEIMLLNTLSWLPFMKTPCSKAVDRVIQRQEESYGPPTQPGTTTLRPTPRLRSHSLAAGVPLPGFNRGGASQLSSEVRSADEVV